MLVPMRLLCGVLLLAALMVPLPAISHEGHDHGPAAPVPADRADTPSMLEADGGDVQLVGLLRGPDLTLFIDRLADNSPVTEAKVTLSVDGGAPVPVPAAADGTYQLAVPWAGRPGDYALALTVTGDGMADLLVGTLTVPRAATEKGPDGGIGLGALLAGMGVGFALGLLLAAGIALMRRRGTGLVLVLLVLLSWPAGRVLAHEGHDHGGPADVAPPFGTRPARLPDGGLFVPKPTQRLLSVRTMLLDVGQVAPVRPLAGRIIADPNRSGWVQSPQSGRLMPPEGGFPLPGTVVKAEQVLAYVEPVLRVEEGGGISEQLAGLDREIRLARQQWERVSKLSGAVPQREIDAAQTNLDGLLRQRRALSRAQVARVPLVAPIDGVITATSAIAGMMIEDRDVTPIFELADPGVLLVEALSFDGPPPPGAGFVAAIGARAVPLVLVGQGPGPAGATRLLLRLPDGETWGERPPVAGAILSLFLRTGPVEEGLLLPRTALVRGPDGLPAILEHAGAQRFVPHAVRTVPAGAEHVRVLAGADAGMRIVVQGADLLNQIR
ncbi:hypothetical protein [Niveispirillum fermenti]|uniref:hypothetical protein n=1 Tax=Niveispirillum fermenti TaxID=1233113 RepID=UPI003A86D0A2